MFLRRILFDKAGDGGSGGGTGGNSGGDGAGSSGGSGGSGTGAAGDGGPGGKGGTGNGTGGGGNAPDLLFQDNGGKGGNGAGNGNAGAGKGSAGDSNANSGQKGGAGDSSVTIPANWKEILPVELRDDPNIKLMEDIPTMAKTLINAQKMIGADKIVIPGKHATDADWKEVAHKLGNPRELAEYKMDIDKETEGLMDKEFIEAFKKEAHGLGVLPRQATALAKFFGNLNKDSWQKMEVEHNNNKMEGMKALEKEWGTTFQEKTSMAKAAIREFVDPKDQPYLRDLGLGSDARFLKIMSKVGATLSEDKLRDSGAGGDFNRGMSPSEAQTKINEVMKDMKHPYFHADHPENKAAKAEVTRLYSFVK